MSKTIFLVRHGIVKKYPYEDEFDTQGISFAEKLHFIIGKVKIDFIGILDNNENDTRCCKTVKKLAEINNIKPLRLTLNEISDSNMLKHNVSVICFTKNKSKGLFNIFEINYPNNSDLLYEFIYKVNLIDNSFETIKTGFSKK
jgi:hypothetical protein